MPCMCLPVLTDFLDSLEAQIPELQAVVPSLPAILGLYVFVCAVLFDVPTRKNGRHTEWYTSPLRIIRVAPLPLR